MRRVRRPPTLGQLITVVSRIDTALRGVNLLELLASGLAELTFSVVTTNIDDGGNKQHPPTLHRQAPTTQRTAVVLS